MTLQLPDFSKVKKGESCKNQFRLAYENRYTWPKTFSGYYGAITFQSSTDHVEGRFFVESNFNSKVEGVKDELISKAIKSQLWEVTIHRVKRPFQEVHGDNTFTLGDLGEYGYEIIVGGKNKGDRYRIKNGYVSMVYRLIHGKYVLIYTDDIIDTKQGYLSHKYTSEYSDPKTGKSLSLKSHYEDTFSPISTQGPWVLTKRIIHGQQENSNFSQSFTFTDLKEYN